MCVNCQAKFNIFGNAVAGIMAGVGISLPLVALALALEKSECRVNEWMRHSRLLRERLDDLEDDRPCNCK